MKAVKGILIFFILLAGLLSPGYARDKSQPAKKLADPRSYFPMDIGREWTYSIKIGEVKPMIYENVTIAKGGRRYNFAHVGSIIPRPNVNRYRLRIKVKSPYQKRLMSVELKVLKDELGIFRYTKRVLWGVESFPPSQTVILQAATYSATELMSVYPFPQLRDSDWISSSRIIFLWGGGKIVQEDKDSFSFVGTDNAAPGCQRIPCYHFVREVHSPGAKSFTEGSWYASGKGLVRLEQKVEGITSMVWTLERYKA